MTDRSAAVFKGIAALLAGLGLLPYVWTGMASGEWSVARLTLIDPLIVAAICIGVALAAPAPLRRGFDRAAVALLKVPTSVLLGVVSIVIVVSGTIVAYLAYAGEPALTDELSQAFQGRILMSGRLAALPETYREFFETPQTVNVHGRWFSEYPIGSGALSAFSEWTRLGSLVNPILLALAAIATWSFARRAYDETTARVALILTALSPFALLMSATRMNHVPTLTFTAAALAALAHWTTAPSGRARLWAAAGIGASIGAMVLIRPYDAALVAIPIAIFQLCHPDHREGSVPSFAAQILAGAVLVVFQLWVNHQTTGNALLFGYDALNGAAHRPGFHVNPLGFPFTPSDGLDLVMLYLGRLNTSLFESAVPALVFIIGALWLTKPSRWDWLLAGLILAMLTGYGAYWFDGVFNGPRFLFPAVVAFVVFTARFMLLAGRRQERWGLGAALMVPMCLAIALVPARVGQRSTGIWLRLSSVIRPASEIENPAEEARRAGLANALVLVREPLHSRITARLRALGLAPYEAERTVGDLDACGLLTALAKSDAHPEIPPSDRLRAVLDEARRAGATRLAPGLRGGVALSLVDGRASSAECYREIVEDSIGTGSFARFLAASNIDSVGRLGGEVIFARTLGARDSILLREERFAGRAWYLYRRGRDSESASFERIR